MRITKGKCKRRSLYLKNIAPGEPVTFCAQFHQDHCVTDMFIVVNHNGYMDYNSSISHESKIAVVNLHNVKMSVVDSQRECFKVKGEFMVEGECNV